MHKNIIKLELVEFTKSGFPIFHADIMHDTFNLEIHLAKKEDTFDHIEVDTKGNRWYCVKPINGNWILTFTYWNYKLPSYHPDGCMREEFSRPHSKEYPDGEWKSYQCPESGKLDELDREFERRGSTQDVDSPKELSKRSRSIIIVHEVHRRHNARIKQLKDKISKKTLQAVMPKNREIRKEKTKELRQLEKDLQKLLRLNPPVQPGTRPRYVDGKGVKHTNWRQ